MPFSSQNSKDYIPIINNMVKPGYNSKYSGQLNNVIDRILNREDFTYDVGKDPLFSQYKQQYVELGKEAAANAVSAVSNLTAGYGNSYAASAASQSNQQYLTQMNERIPSLMNAAMQKYQLEKENLYKQFGALQNEESRLYSQYRDTTEDYYRDVAGLESDYARVLAQENTLAERAYRAERDKRADYEWNETFNRTKDRDAQSDYQWSKNFERTKSNDAISDQQWQEKFDYKKQRDLVSDDQWQKEFELKQLQEALKSAKGSSGGRRRRKKSTEKTESEPTWMTSKTQDLFEKMTRYTDEKKAKEIAKSLVEKGEISEADGNRLQQVYEANHSKKTKDLDPLMGFTPQEIGKIIESEKNRKENRTVYKGDYKYVYKNGKLVSKTKFR